MMGKLCGIELDPDNEMNLRKQIDKILYPEKYPETAKKIAIQFSIEYYTTRNSNPHALNKSMNVVDYIRHYLPQNLWMIKYF